MSFSFKLPKFRNNPKTLLNFTLAGFFIFAAGIAVLEYRDFKVAQAASISDILVTNVTESSVSIVWQTEKMTTGSIIVSQEKIGKSILNKLLPPDQIFYDDRDTTEVDFGKYEIKKGGPEDRYTHHVTVRGLEPETQYNFSVRQGGYQVDTELKQFTTSTISEDFVTPDPVYGTVYNSDSQAVTDGIAIIYLDNDQELSQPLSAPVNETGSFSLDISNARDSDLKGKYETGSKYYDLVFVWSKHGEIMRRVQSDYDQPIGQEGRDGDILRYRPEAVKGESTASSTAGVFTNLVTPVSAGSPSEGCAAGDTSVETYGECCGAGMAREIRKCSDASSGVFYYKFSACDHAAVNCPGESQLDKTCNNNGVRDCGGYSGGNCESGVDCGNSVCGSCAANPEENCGVPDHCTNGVKDQGLEEAVDCGGACPSCGGRSEAAEKTDAVPVGEAGCPPDDCDDPPYGPPPEPPPPPPYSCKDYQGRPNLVRNGKQYEGCIAINNSDYYCCPDKNNEPTGVCCQMTEPASNAGELVWKEGVSNCGLEFSRDSKNYPDAKTQSQCTGSVLRACPTDYPVELDEKSDGYECNTVGEKKYKNGKFCCRAIEQHSCEEEGYIPFSYDYSFNEDYHCYETTDDPEYPWCCKYTSPNLCSEYPGYEPRKEAELESGAGGNLTCVTTDDPTYPYCCKFKPVDECNTGFKEANATERATAINNGKKCYDRLGISEGESNKYCCEENQTVLQCPNDFPNEVTGSDYDYRNGRDCRAISSGGKYLFCCKNGEDYRAACPADHDFVTSYGHSPAFGSCYQLDTGSTLPQYCCPKETGPIFGPLEIGLIDAIGDLFREEGDFDSSTDSDSSIIQKIRGIFVADKTYAQEESSKTDVPPGSYTVDILNSDYKATTKKIDVGRVNSVVFYFDDNKNGVRDAEEPYLTDEESNLIQLSLKKVADMQTYNLNAGWNLLSFPMVMQTEETSQITTASQLLDAFNKQDADVTHIAAYRSGKFLIYSQRENTDTEIFKYGEDFTLIPGEGYVVKTQRSATVSLKGNMVEGPLTVVLSPGWNLTGIYSSGKEYYDAVDVLNQMKAQLVNADVISKFEDGTYKNLVISGGEQYGFTYNVYPEIGYFLRVRNDTKVTFEPK